MIYWCQLCCLKCFFFFKYWVPVKRIFCCALGLVYVRMISEVWKGTQTLQTKPILSCWINSKISNDVPQFLQNSQKLWQQFPCLPQKTTPLLKFVMVQKRSAKGPWKMPWTCRTIPWWTTSTWSWCKWGHPRKRMTWLTWIILWTKIANWSQLILYHCLFGFCWLVVCLLVFVVCLVGCLACCWDQEVSGLQPTEKFHKTNWKGTVAHCAWATASV